VVDLPTKIETTLLIKDRNHVGRRTPHTQRHEMCVPHQFLLRSFQVQENTFIQIK